MSFRDHLPSRSAFGAYVISLTIVVFVSASTSWWVKGQQSQLRYSLLTELAQLQSHILTHSMDQLRFTREELSRTAEEKASLHQDLEIFREKILLLDQALDIRGSLFTDKKSYRIRQAIGGAEVRCVGLDCDDTDLLHIQLPKKGQGLIGQLEARIELLENLPLSLPVKNGVSSVFGMRRSPFSGVWKHHQGLDFKTPYRSRLHAAGSGTVVAVRRDPTYGLYIDIQHTDTIISRYAHLSRALVSEGQSVSRNQYIGLSGSSGRSTGPHLHYEVRVNDRAKDPVPYFMLGKKLRSLLPAES